MKRTPIDLQTAINTFSDNGGAANTATKLRGILTDMKDSLSVANKIFFQDNFFRGVVDFVSAYVGSGANTISNGMLQMLTGAVQDDYNQMLSAAAQFMASNNSRIETKVNLPSSSDFVFRFGLSMDATHYAYLEVDTSVDTNFRLNIKQAGDEDLNINTGISYGDDSTYSTLSFWLDTDGTLHLAINGAEILTGHTTKVVAGHKMYYKLLTKTAAAVLAGIIYYEFEMNK